MTEETRGVRSVGSEATSVIGAPMIGINVSSATSFRLARRLFASGTIDFAELLVDNFLHLDPERCREELDGMPVAFHIMASRFTDAPVGELATVADRVNRWIDTVNPRYVSDHLARHQYGVQRLPSPWECPYERDVLDRVRMWQGMISRPLLLENFPSVVGDGRDQVEFFAVISRETPARLLFDFSNAIVAQLNTGLAATAWFDDPSMAVTAAHISGYRRSDADGRLTLDSHDCAVSQKSWDLLSTALALGNAPTSLVVERDDRLDDPAWVADLERAREMLETMAPC